MLKIYNYFMKGKQAIQTALLTVLMAFLMTPAQANLVLTGVLDGPLSNGISKGAELFVTADIADLSMYGIGSANNGQGTDGEEFTFPAGAYTAGTYIYVATDSAGFFEYMGFYPDFTDSAMEVNGDDAVEVFMGGNVIDIFGDINTDGSGESWEYLDSWVYRKNGTGPDGTTFVGSNWTYAGVDVLDGCATNATCASVFPAGTYTTMGSGTPEFDFTASAFSVSEGDAAGVNVALSMSADCTIEVALDASSTAVEGTDFTFSSPQTLTFAAGDTTIQTISIPTIDNTDSDGERTIVLNLANSGGAGGCGIGTTDQVTITITDNDYQVADIAAVTAEDADGVATSLGSLVTLTGIVHCTNFRGGNGYDFALIDATGGITVFSFDDVDDYVMTEGDELSVSGEIAQFRGLTQLQPQAITVVSQGNAVNDYQLVTALDESTESLPIRLSGVSVVDPTQIGELGDSYNLDVTDGTNNFLVRVDSDANIPPDAIPTTGTFDIIGTGGQFGSSSAPFLDGYQIRPCGPGGFFTGIDAAFGTQFSMYPNPVNEQLIIETDIANYQVIISDMLGRELLRRNVSSNAAINTTSLQGGMYLVTVVADDKMWAEKIIK